MQKLIVIENLWFQLTRAALINDNPWLSNNICLAGAFENGLMYFYDCKISWSQRIGSIGKFTPGYYLILLDARECKQIFGM